MTGIQFIIDAKGCKRAAIIDLKMHRTLWNDFQDVLVFRLRPPEKRTPLETLQAALINKNRQLPD
jgi:hypothetical protein